MVTLSSFALTKKSTILLFGAFLTLSILDTCHAANTTKSEAESMEKGMDFLFQMTKGFLELIQPKRIYEKFKVEQLINDGVYRENTLKDWRGLALYFVGYAVCAAIGILFIIVMPIIGCCLCCCRTCCKKCGGKHRKHDPKNAKYKRGCYITFLTIFNTFILFAVVCTFVTNQLYQKRFIADDEIFNVAKKGTKDFINYVDNSFQEVKNVAKKQMSSLETDFIAQLQNVGNKTVTTFSQNIKATPVLDEVKDLGQGIVKLKDSVSQLIQSLTNLSDTGKTLENQLDMVKNSVLKKLKTCNISECSLIETSINSTSVNAQFSKLNNQSELLQKLNNFLDIPDLVEQAKSIFKSISENVTEVMSKQNKTIIENLNQISNKVDSTLDNVTEIKKNIPIDRVDKEINNAFKEYNSNETYSKIPWYIGLCVGSILLLIVVCNYLGILFGLCGERAGENTPCCNRGVAANFFLAGVGFYFIFCWILIILVLIQFLLGGILYTEACRYLNKDDPKQLKPILLNFNFTYKVLDDDIPLVTADIVDKCYNNKSILNSINFPINLLEKYIKIQPLIDQIEKISKNDIKILDVKLLDKTLKDKLDGFKQLKTNSINFTEYEIELNKTVVSTNLTEIARNLTALAKRVKISFQNESQELKRIESTTYVVMKNEMNNLGRILSEVKKNINLDEKVSGLIDTMTNVEKSIEKNGTGIIRQIVSEEITGLIKIAKDNVDILFRNIVNNVAPCRPVYDILFSFTDILCVTFLNPWNGFWFSTGWAVFFFLPTIIFATKLAGLYRCWYKNDPTHENPDSYVAGDADNIPLARVNQGKSSPQGLPNSAYDEISSNKYHPPPNHPYYGGHGHHYSGYPVYPPPSYHDNKQGTPEEGWRIQRPKRVFKYHNKDEVELLVYSDKQGTPEEGWRIQQPKCCAFKYHNKDEDNSPKIQHNIYKELYNHTPLIINTYLMSQSKNESWALLNPYMKT